MKNLVLVCVVVCISFLTLSCDKSMGKVSELEDRVIYLEEQVALLNEDLADFRKAKHDKQEAENALEKKFPLVKHEELQFRVPRMVFDYTQMNQGHNSVPGQIDYFVRSYPLESLYEDEDIYLKHEPVEDLNEYAKILKQAMDAGEKFVLGSDNGELDNTYNVIKKDDYYIEYYLKSTYDGIQKPGFVYYVIRILKDLKIFEIHVSVDFEPRIEQILPDCFSPVGSNYLIWGSEGRENFYEKLVSLDKSLPEYLILFQKSFEKVLETIQIDSKVSIENMLEFEGKDGNIFRKNYNLCFGLPKEFVNVNNKVDKEKKYIFGIDHGYVSTNDDIQTSIEAKKYVLDGNRFATFPSYHESYLLRDSYEVIKKNDDVIEICGEYVQSDISINDGKKSFIYRVNIITDDYTYAVELTTPIDISLNKIYPDLFTTVDGWNYKANATPEKEFYQLIKNKDTKMPEDIIFLRDAAYNLVDNYIISEKELPEIKKDYDKGKI